MTNDDDSRFIVVQLASLIRGQSETSEKLAALDALTKERIRQTDAFHTSLNSRVSSLEVALNQRVSEVDKRLDRIEDKAIKVADEAIGEAKAYNRVWGVGAAVIAFVASVAGWFGWEALSSLLKGLLR